MKKEMAIALSLVLLAATFGGCAKKNYSKNEIRIVTKGWRFGFGNSVSSYPA
ncbi:hypothetical protein [Hydrogenimonas sp.]